MSWTQVIFLRALTKILGCVVSGICFVYLISQKVTAVFFFFPGRNMVRGLWTSFGKSFIIINLPTPKKMIIYYKASFSKFWTQSAYLLSVASNLCVIHFSLTSALPRLIYPQFNSLSVFYLFERMSIITLHVHQATKSQAESDYSFHLIIQ